MLYKVQLYITWITGYRFNPSNSFNLGVPFVELDQGCKENEFNGNDVISPPA